MPASDARSRTFAGSRSDCRIFANAAIRPIRSLKLLRSYIDGLKAAGLENLTVDQIISLKIQGVTPEYVKSMRDLGMSPDPTIWLA